MEIQFSNPEKADNKLEEVLKQEEKTYELYEAVEFRRERIVEDLFNAVKILKDKASWTKNVEITNKQEEKERFLEARRNGENFQPDFKFAEFPYNEETFVELIDILEGETQKITQSTLDRYGAEEITVLELREFFEEIFEELKLYVELAAEIEDREKWKRKCEDLWPMVNKEAVEESKQRVQELEPEEEEKNINAEELKEMWEEELDRLGVEYNVEIREVGGCFNIPEEETVVVAKGKGEERLYSESEAKILTMHELFHVVRAYNGRKACVKSDFPPILGVHTPFYDQTEEGGAIYREHETEVITESQEFDYHLRLLAAYWTYQDIQFEEIVESLIDLGGTPERSFYLAARNREVLRHHIYYTGYREDWKDNEDIEPLLIGKLNSQWAEIWKKEAEAEGMIGKPEVGAEELFDYRFND